MTDTRLIRYAISIRELHAVAWCCCYFYGVFPDFFSTTGSTNTVSMALPIQM